MNVSGSIMTLEHFQDFYYLEALRANITMAKSANPELAFRRAVEKLETDVNETFDVLCERMAHRIYVYLWGAALGEAFYANENCDEQIPELDNFSYKDALNYCPTEENVDIVKQVFSQSWASGGYGGAAWLSIVEGMELYGKVNNATFIDHAMDLEHNGGCVFDKTGNEPFKLNCCGKYGTYELKHFLDYKFSEDILQGNRKVNVSRKVHSLAVRFSNIIRKIKAVEFMSPNLEFISSISLEWGNDTLSLTESSGGMSCEDCGVKIDEDDHCHSPSEQCICSDCFYRNYETCGGCGQVVDNDDYVSDLDLCASCAKRAGNVQCEDCYEWTDEYTEIEGSFYCEKCKEEHGFYCEKCKTWTVDECMEHNKTEDSEEKDEENELPYEFTQGEVALYSQTVKAFYYDFPEHGLKVLDISKIDESFQNNTWVVVPPLGLWFSPKSKSRKDAVELANKVKNMLDWNLVKTKKDWQNVPKEKVEELRKIVEA